VSNAYLNTFLGIPNVPVRIVPPGKSRTEWRKHLRAFEKRVKKQIKEERAALERGAA
jgi:hypothetical protein